MESRNPMDDIVRQAMAKWPHVPACYGWLGLDARGQWYMRDEQAQAAGAFSCGSRQAKGSHLQHAKLIDFIARNYACDAEGNWFFQNGPQRVYVELESTPWIWRINADMGIQTHTGLASTVLGCLVDEQGRVYLNTPLGLGLVHTLDVYQAAEALELGIWKPQEVNSGELASKFHFHQSPQAQNMIRNKQMLY
jgi:hypothetical protein